MGARSVRTVISAVAADALQFDLQDGVLTTDLHFAIVPRWICRHPDLTAQAVRLYAVLADHANTDGKSFPKRRTLARECGSQVSTIDRALMLLITTKCMSIHHRKGRSSVYTIHRVPPGSVVTSEEGPFSTKRTGEETSVVTGEETSKKSRKEEERTRLSDFPKESRSEMWSAFVGSFGVPVGAMEHRYRDALLDALKAGIWPSQIDPARRRYREGWPTVACNPQALVNNWNTFGPTSRLQDVPADIRHLYEGTEA